MYKNEYLQSANIRNFIDWIEERLDKPNSFSHFYTMKRPATSWECHSIYSAYENYCWAFTYKDPFSGKKITGSSFTDNWESLSRLSVGLRRSISDLNVESCRNHCLSILEWGGVLNKNDKKINELGKDICNYLVNAKDTFTGDMLSREYYSNQIIMNSGFTKIYSLCIDGFIIYDGRVGAALGLLVRKFCEDNALDIVPTELTFAWGKGKESSYKSSKENKRNPGNNKYIFPELSNNPRRHTENNIRANWLLGEIVNNTESSFKKLDKKVQMRALEAALFMIGYKVG